MSAADIRIIADEWPQMEPLLARLKGEGYRTSSVEDKDAGPLSGHRAVVMFVHKVVSQATVDAMVRYAQEGGRLLVLHHGIASAKLQNPAWLAFTGMHIEPKDAPHNPWTLMVDVTHDLVRLHPDHYIATNGVAYPDEADYVSSDAPSRAAHLPSIRFTGTEFFKNQHFADGRAKTVLFGSKCTTKGGQVVMQDRGGWLKPAGRGWIFYFQPGHLPQDFEKPAYQQILLNCLTWNPP